MGVALVTGASRGIGRAIALRLAEDGHDGAVAYGRDAQSAERVAEEVRAAGARAVVAGGDLAEPPVAGALVDAAEERLGPVDVLVANAGINAEPTGVGGIALEAWDRLMAVNLRAPFLPAQRLARAMAQRGFGRIVFVSSVAACTGGIIGAHYASSKAGLHGLAHSLAKELAGHGVTANVVAPALVESDMLPADPAVREELAASLPVGRLGTSDEVADLIAAIVRNGFVANQAFLI